MSLALLRSQRPSPFPFQKMKKKRARRETRRPPPAAGDFFARPPMKDLVLLALTSDGRDSNKRVFFISFLSLNLSFKSCNKERVGLLAVSFCARLPGAYYNYHPCPRSCASLDHLHVSVRGGTIKTSREEESVGFVITRQTVLLLCTQ